MATLQAMQAYSVLALQLAAFPWRVPRRRNSATTAFTMCHFWLHQVGQATRVELLREGADFRGLKDALLQKVQPPMPFAVPVWAGETVIQGDLVDSLAMHGKQPLAEGVDILAQHLLFRR